eukprot:364627-Chlamydomonas_euryale.AAC.4
MRRLLTPAARAGRQTCSGRCKLPPGASTTRVGKRGPRGGRPTSATPRTVNAEAESQRSSDASSLHTARLLTICARSRRNSPQTRRRARPLSPRWHPQGSAAPFALAAAPRTGLLCGAACPCRGHASSHRNVAVDRAARSPY